MTNATTDSEVEQALTPRLLYLDNLRVALVALVVMHHVAMTYGAAGMFYFVEFDPTGFSRTLLVFVLANQAWFMGAFFLIAGYFTPGSYDRKGARGFASDRSFRLAIPTILYALFLNPLAWIGAFFLPVQLGQLSWETYEYREYVRMGPMWFVVMLLVFSLGYAMWRSVAGQRDASDRRNPSVPGYGAIALFTLALAGVSYLVRIAIPIGEEVLGFPSLAYLPQYLSFFVLGVLANQGDWLNRLSSAKGIAGAGMAIVGSVALFPLAFSGEMFSMELSELLSEAMGDGTWRSAVYAMWDSMLAVGLTMALVVLFGSFLNRQGKFGEYLSRHGFTVYFIHMPIVVFTAVVLREVEAEHLVKVGLAGLIALVTCWTIAYPVRSIPWLSKYL